MIQWQPIETAPMEPETEVLLWIPHSEPDASGYFAIGKWGRDAAIDKLACWVDRDGNYYLGEPTHWAPLNPPERTMSKTA